MKMNNGLGVTGLDVVGRNVKKISGYPYPGVIVAAFLTTSGKERYVVEATETSYQGMLHIFSGTQLELV